MVKGKIKEYICPVCKGEKKHVVAIYWFKNPFRLVECEYCNGTGKIPKEKVYIRKRPE